MPQAYMDIQSSQTCTLVLCYQKRDRDALTGCQTSKPVTLAHHHHAKSTSMGSSSCLLARHVYDSTPLNGEYYNLEMALRGRVLVVQ